MRSCSSGVSAAGPPAQQPEQAFDVVSEGGDALNDRPDFIQPHGIDEQAAQHGQDLDVIILAVAVGVLPQWHIAHQVPAVLD